MYVANNYQLYYSIMHARKLLYNAEENIGKFGDCL